MHCESAYCGVHRGEVRKVLIEGKDGGMHVHHYCEQAVMEDDYRGFRLWDFEGGYRLGGDEIEMRYSQVLAEVEMAVSEYERLRDRGRSKEYALKSVLDVCHTRLRNHLFDRTSAVLIGGQEGGNTDDSTG